MKYKLLQTILYLSFVIFMKEKQRWYTKYVWNHLVMDDFSGFKTNDDQWLMMKKGNQILEKFDFRPSFKTSFILIQKAFAYHSIYLRTQWDLKKRFVEPVPTTTYVKCTKLCTRISFWHKNKLLMVLHSNSKRVLFHLTSIIRVEKS